MSRTRRSYPTWYHRWSKFGRDKKPWWKPNRPFKKLRQTLFRAQVKDALAKQAEPPLNRKTDVWDWN